VWELGLDVNGFEIALLRYAVSSEVELEHVVSSLVADVAGSTTTNDSTCSLSSEFLDLGKQVIVAAGMSASKIEVFVSPKGKTPGARHGVALTSKDSITSLVVKYPMLVWSLGVDKTVATLSTPSLTIEISHKPLS
jgi:hypothetical protein